MRSSTSTNLGRLAGWIVRIVLLVSVSGFLRALFSEGWDSRTRTTVLICSLVPFGLSMLFLLGGSIKDRIKYRNDPVVSLKIGTRKVE